MDYTWRDDNNYCTWKKLTIVIIRLSSVQNPSYRLRMHVIINFREAPSSRKGVDYARFSRHFLFIHFLNTNNCVRWFVIQASVWLSWRYSEFFMVSLLVFAGNLFTVVMKVVTFLPRKWIHSQTSCPFHKMLVNMPHILHLTLCLECSGWILREEDTEEFETRVLL